MAERAKPLRGSEESIELILSSHRKQCSLLSVLERMDAKHLSNVGVVVGIMVGAVSDSCRSLLLLAEHRKFRDCLVVARTIYLSIVNICFICARGEVAARRAARHAHQKAYRDLQRRDLRINDKKMTIKWTGSVDLDQSPELKAAVNEFTGSKGREVRSWTAENVQKQLEAIDKKYGEDVSMLLLFGLTQFRHSSEVVHGTLFGALWALGTFVPNPEGRETAEIEIEHVRSGLFLTLLIVNCCVVSLIRVLEKDAFANGPSLQAGSQSRAILNELLERVEFGQSHMSSAWYAKYTG
jgi:Family of unknown function (DUF5677)